MPGGDVASMATEMTPYLSAAMAAAPHVTSPEPGSRPARYIT